MSQHQKKMQLHAKSSLKYLSPTAASFGFRFCIIGGLPPTLLAIRFANPISSAHCCTIAHACLHYDRSGSCIDNVIGGVSVL